MGEPTSPLRAVAEALTIWHELEPRPAVEDGYTPETEAWLERHNEAAGQLAAEAAQVGTLSPPGVNLVTPAAALRAAHGPPWDSDEPRPVALGLLISAAIELER